MAGRAAGSFDSYDMHGYSSYHAGAPATSALSSRSTSNERSRLTQIISTNVHKLTQNVEQMHRLINQIGTPTDTLELHDKLHQVQHYSNQLAKETNQYLKELAHLPSSGTQSEQRERRLQQERLLNSFTTALNSFQSAQRKQKDRETAHRASRARRQPAFDGFGDTAAGDEDKLISVDNGAAVQHQQQTMEFADEEEELLRDHEQSLRQLESDIMDVNQIFKDLSILVHEQGDVVDSIEANVERSALNVERGTEQLLHARDYQSKARRRKLCLLLTVMIILAIFIIILVIALRN